MKKQAMFSTISVQYTFSFAGYIFSNSYLPSI